MTYAVHWPDLGILEVGRAWRMSCIRSFMGSGEVAGAEENLCVLMDAINAVADRAQRTLDIEDW